MILEFEKANILASPKDVIDLVDYSLFIRIKKDLRNKTFLFIFIGYKVNVI